LSFEGGCEPGAQRRVGGSLVGRDGAGGAGATCLPVQSADLAADVGLGIEPRCDTRSHVVSELVKGGLADARDVATGLCSTCPRRDVRGRFPIGWVRSSRESPRAVAPAMAVTGEGKDRRATTREPLLMPRHYDTPGWAAVPGWQGLAVERRQAAATDLVMASGHRRPRGIEGARPGPGLTRAERGNLVRVRRAGAGMRRRGGRPTVRGAESRWRDRVTGKRKPAAERQQESGTACPGLPPDGARITGRIPADAGPERELTQSGEPLEQSERECRNRRASWAPW
jgi:hypothetical protein